MNNSRRMTGKHALLQTLQAEEVRHIFGNPGTSESAIMSTLAEYPDLKYILTLQEGVAMGMADGYAWSSGKVSFVNLHIETGLANGVSLLHHAWDGGTPLVLTAGNRDIRKLPEGRSNLVEMVRQFTKWSAEVTHPEQIPAVLRRAFHESRTPPTGPTFVAFAANALEDEADVRITPPDHVYTAIRPDAVALLDATRLLANAQHPVIVVGDRLAQSGGQAEAATLAELIGARVYTMSYAQISFPTGHPQFLGRINPALSSGRERLAAADVVLAVGTSVFGGFFYSSEHPLARSASLIHLDSASQEIGKQESTTVGMLADPKIGLRQLADSVANDMSPTQQENARRRCDAVASEQRKRSEEWEARIRQRWDSEPMSPERMVTELARSLPADAIIIDDSLSNKEAVHAAMKFNKPGSLYGERMGAIGWGMGAALGVKLANPERPVIGIVGDGSAMMTVQALWTAANYNIPAVYIVCNNRSYRILKQNMNIYKTEILHEPVPSSYVAMDFPLPLNLAAIANVMGVDGLTVTDPTEIGPALNRALISGRPALVDVVIDGNL
jgi:benzoylformate decarboxylase